jgi:hypothetical protein
MIFWEFAYLKHATFAKGCSPLGMGMTLSSIECRESFKCYRFRIKTEGYIPALCPEQQLKMGIILNDWHGQAIKA